MLVHTIGHSTRPLAAFIALLQEAEIDLLVDIRSVPRSRRNPDYNLETLPGLLAPAGIGHLHIRTLGGLRGKPKDRGPSPNSLWEHPAFRNYADYALTPPFHQGLEELLALAAERRPAIMCAEALWWQCHRRIVTDYLLSTGCTVRHIMGPGKIDPAKLTPGAVVEAPARLLYPAEQGSLL
jgi:uncharacterized protein (DUF488 family)